MRTLTPLRAAALALFLAAGPTPAPAADLAATARQKAEEQYGRLAGLIAAHEELLPRVGRALELVTALDAALGDAGPLWLSRFFWDGESVELDGITLSLEHVTRFIGRRLEGGGYFTGVQMLDGEKVDGPDREFFRFSLRGEVSFGGGGGPAVPAFPFIDDPASLSGEELAAGLRELEAALRDRGKHLLGGRDLERALKHLAGFAGESGLEIRSFGAGEEAKRGSYGEIPVRFVLRGPFEGIPPFFEKVSRHPVMMSIPAFSLERHSQEGGKVTLKAQVSLLCYRALSDGEVDRR